mmetsp:Transcript_77837/g.128661  ORF Transcript_77837/g.128661 Transcript_77837/m.128661 type:complete len:207 (-) Transcript_77837:4-624(-)
MHTVTRVRPAQGRQGRSFAHDGQLQRPRRGALGGDDHHVRLQELQNLFKGHETTGGAIQDAQQHLRRFAASAARPTVQDLRDGSHGRVVTALRSLYFQAIHFQGVAIDVFLVLPTIQLRQRQLQLPSNGHRRRHRPEPLFVIFEACSAAGPSKVQRGRRGLHIPALGDHRAGNAARRQGARRSDPGHHRGKVELHLLRFSTELLQT